MMPRPIRELGSCESVLNVLAQIACLRLRSFAKNFFTAGSSLVFVKAKAQSYILHELEAELQEEERNIVRRGRNAHPHTVPKNADVADYRLATAYETLIGYLYLAGDRERLAYILERSVAIGSLRNE